MKIYNGLSTSMRPTLRKLICDMTDSRKKQMTTGLSHRPSAEGVLVLVLALCVCVCVFVCLTLSVCPSVSLP